jgi:hypothetical protein
MKWIIIHRETLGAIIIKEYEAESVSELIDKWFNDACLTSKHILSITRSN